MGFLRTLGLVCLVGCGGSGAEDRSEDALWGGAPEGGYPAVGHQLMGQDPAYMHRAGCGVTVIGRHWGLTAAHCTDPGWYRLQGMALGEAASARQHIATAIFTTGAYDIDAPLGWRHSQDYALMYFPDGVDKVTPAAMAFAAPGCEFRGIHYGLGQGPRHEGRKSAEVCLDDVDETTLRARPQGAGLCHGDSGGPLFRAGTRDLVGILTDFAPRWSEDTAYCRYENDMIYTPVTAFRDFVGCVQRQDLAPHRALSADAPTTALVAVPECRFDVPTRTCQLMSYLNHEASLRPLADGDRGTPAWTAATGPAEIEVDLEGRYWVDTVRISQPSGGRVSHLEVEVATPNKATRLIGRLVRAAPRATDTLQLKTPRLATKVRVRAMPPRGGGPVSLSEIEVCASYAP